MNTSSGTQSTAPDKRSSPRPTRRSVLAFGAGAGLAGLVGTMGLSRPVLAAAGTGAGLIHPGTLHTSAELDFVDQQLMAGDQPWESAWSRLTSNSAAGPTSSSPLAIADIDRGGSINNFARLYLDCAAAYQTALRWRLGADDAYGARSAQILNAWATTVTEVTGDADRYLLAGLQGAQLAHAAELVRDRDDLDSSAVEAMLLNVFYPLCNDFLVNHNGAFLTNYWPSWDILTMSAVMAIGIFTDRQDLLDQAIEYFISGAGLGSLLHAAPQLVDDAPGDQQLAQWIEVGRDQGHTLLGIGLMTDVCEMAWHQGTDLYSYQDYRFMRAAQYVAKYNSGQDVPYPAYTWKPGAPGIWSGSQTITAPNPTSRGQIRPIWDRIYGHYNGRLGMDVPYIAQLAATARPDGGGGDYESTSGGYDQLGFTTLTSYRSAPLDQ